MLIRIYISNVQMIVEFFRNNLNAFVKSLKKRQVSITVKNSVEFNILTIFLTPKEMTLSSLMRVFFFCFFLSIFARG